MYPAVGWSQLILIQETILCIFPQLQIKWHHIDSLNGHGGRIYTTDISKCHYFPPESQLLDIY